MIHPPYPPPLTALDMLYLDPKASPTEAVDVLQRKINEVTRLVYAYMQFQQPLARYIVELQARHAEDIRLAQDAIQGLITNLKSVNSKFEENTKRLVKLQAIVAAKPPVEQKRQTLQDAMVDHYDPKLEVKPASLPPYPEIKADAPSTSGSPSSEDSSSDGEWTSTLKMQISQTESSLADLIKTINNKDDSRRGDDTNVGHGCFDGLATNCWSASNWDTESRRGRVLQLLAKVETEQVTGVMRAKRADEAATALERKCRKQGLIPEAEASRPHHKQPGIQSSNATSTSQRQTISEKAPDSHNVYTFTLSTQLDESKSLDDLTREEAVDILKTFPLKVSFAPDAPIGRYQLHFTDSAEWETEKRAEFSRKTNTVTLWRRGAHGAEVEPADEEVVQSTKEDRKGKGRMYPSTFVPTTKRTDAQSTATADPGATEREATRQERATRKRIPREAVEPGSEPEGGDDDDDAGTTEEKAKSKPKRTRAKKAEAEADPAEETPPAPAQPTKVRRGKTATEKPLAAPEAESADAPRRGKKRSRSEKDTEAVAEESSPVAVRRVRTRRAKGAQDAEDVEAAPEAPRPPVKKRKLRN